MKITAADAVNHIVNSLDNTNASFWYDDENDASWHVGTEDEDILVVEVETQDGLTLNRFMLVAI